MEYYAAIKKDAPLKHSTTWMDLKSIYVELHKSDQKRGHTI